MWCSEVSAARAYNVERAWRKHVSGTEVGLTPVDCLTEERVKRFLLELPVGYDVRLLLLQWFRRLGLRAVRSGHLRYNLFAEVKVRRPPKGFRRPKYWDPRTEVPAILLAAHPEQRLAFECAYWGAMRRGDVRRLRWEHISWRHNTITFHQTKSGRVETIPMVPPLRAALSGVCRDSGLVFPSPHGGPFHRNYTWRLDEVLDRAGVEKQGRNFHAFRHAAAVAAASGVWGEKWSKAEVGKLLRDTTNAVDVYFDMLADTIQAKARAVVLRPASASIMTRTDNVRAISSGVECNLHTVERKAEDPYGRVLREAPTELLMRELNRRLTEKS